MDLDKNQYGFIEKREDGELVEVVMVDLGHSLAEWDSLEKTAQEFEMSECFRDFMESKGWTISTDSTGWYEKNPPKAPMGWSKPYLVGMYSGLTDAGYDVYAEHTMIEKNMISAIEWYDPSLGCVWRAFDQDPHNCGIEAIDRHGVVVYRYSDISDGLINAYDHFSNREYGHFRASVKAGLTGRGWRGYVSNDPEEIFGSMVRIGGVIGG